MIEKNTVPVWGGSFDPFYLVMREGDDWSPSLDEINSNTYDSTKLFRISTNIDIGISPMSLIILFDGTLVVPNHPDIPKTRARSIFNAHLTDLLLGGLLVKEIAPDDVTYGSLNFWGYHRHHTPAGRYSRLSQSLRTRRADPDESINLIEPRKIEIDDYLGYQTRGSAISNKLHPNFPTVFLPATTAYCEENWERSLILGWCSIELLIEQLWVGKITSNAKVNGITQKRRKDFLSDTRTWSSSSRIELLWQKEHMSDELYALIDKARAARNSFIHTARNCTPEDSRSAIKAALLLVDTISSEENLPFDFSATMAKMDESTHEFSSPVADEDGRLLSEPTFWRYPDPAPGFEDWGDRPFEKISEIELKPENEKA